MRSMPRGDRRGRVVPSCLCLALLIGALAVAPALAEDEAAQRLLLEAQRQLQGGNQEAALLEYRALLDRFPESTLAPRALIEMANSHFAADQLEEAGAITSELTTTYGDSVEAAAGLVLQARVQLRNAESLDDLTSTRNILRRIPNLYGYDRYPDLAARSDARVLAAQVSVSIAEDDEALAGFLEALEDEPRSQRTGDARLGMARVLLRQRQVEAALQLLQEVVDDGEEVASPETISQARTILTLAHRMWIRPAAFEPRWQTSRRIQTGGLKRPRAVAASFNGDLLITDPGSSAAIAVSASGDVTATILKDPTRPWFDRAGNGYVALQTGVLALSSGERHRFVPSADKPKPLDKIQAGSTSLFDGWVLLDRATEVPFTCSRDKQPTGTLNRESSAVDLASDRRGNLYVLNAKPSRVSIYRPNNELLLSFSIQTQKPQALDVDDLGNIYVLDSARRAIDVLDNDGTAVVTIGPLLPGGIELKGPEDIAVDGIGRIFIADSKLATVVALE